MTNLSPEALSVWCRFCEVVEDHGPPRLGLAAALRAAADQVVPENANAVGDEHDDARRDQWMRIRYKILAIADELEGQ